MSKTVTIPTGGGNPFVVILGGVKYVYKPGETVEVPDGVALEIEEWERWHEKYYGENEPPFGVQPDLSQNDPNAPDFVKNRTHWSEMAEKTIVDSATSFDDGYYAGSGEINIEPFVGQRVTVIFNGETYKVTLSYDAENNEYIADLPNGAFLCVWESGDGWEWDFTAQEAGHVTVNIMDEVVHKLDSKYLSDDIRGRYIPRFFDIDLYLEDRGVEPLKSVEGTKDINLTKEDYDFLREVASVPSCIAWLSYSQCIAQMVGDNGVVKLYASQISFEGASAELESVSWTLTWDEIRGIAQINTLCKSYTIPTS